MSSNSSVIHIAGVSKYFELYTRNRYRLLQMFCGHWHKFYKEFWALKDISFDVNEGECLGIVGRNGSGKSTLLQILAGTLSPTSGEVQVHGRVAALLELGSGFNPEFTGRENILLNAAILGLSKQEIAKQFDEIVAFADIGDFIDQPVKTYSSGMTLRLAFAVITHVNADILIIDEALAVGDIFFTQKCMRFLRNFIRTKTVVFVSHDVTAVCSLCTRAIFLNQGHVALIGTPAEVSQTYIKAMYEADQGEKRLQYQMPHKIDPFDEKDYHDMRADIFNKSTLRNDIEIFQFNPDSNAFGKGGAYITQVWLSDSEDHPLRWIVGGERVTLHITGQTVQDLESPIVGFNVRNAFGQPLFGDNTYITYRDNPLFIPSDRTFHAYFTFRMPILPTGEYTVDASIAEGTQLKHIEHHWLHEALAFISRTSSVPTGWMGIPMIDIGLDTEKR